MNAGVHSGRALRLPLLANLASLAFLALAGLGLNAMIARLYGPQALGLFNIVFAIFIFASQFGTLGVQYAALRSVAAAADLDEAHRAARAAILVTALSSFAVVLATWLALPLLQRIFATDGLSVAVIAMLPGLFCFALNKVLLAIVNGKDRMFLFAGLQSARYVFVLAIAGWLVWKNVEPPLLILSISAAEVILLPILLLVTREIWHNWQSNLDGWIGRQSAFGLRVMPSGIMAELGTRIDVLLLGAMLGDIQAGLYSIAILLADGYAQAIQVARNVINPRLVAIVATRDQAGLTRLMRSVGLGMLILMLLGGAFLIAVFPSMDLLILGGKFGAAYLPLIILVCGIGVSAPILIFAMILSQGGRPGTLSLFMLAVLAANITGNVIGISLSGLVGAAVGTAVSFVFGAVLLVILVQKIFGLRLI